ncbi:hypothetical protein [Shimazuella kribbensis]|uniref:hypothetical protein n=1 Tax=Shimazuella kribbensis TaxID=139808 RepID=UPI0004053BD7|nr:hypothetical protein [Shimazuella kribbensis]
MACTNTNIIVNGGFRTGLAPWTGTNVKIVKNPVYKNDSSALLRTGSVLKQRQALTIQKGCAYYLYFRLLNVTPSGLNANLFATVSYLDNHGNIIRSTPLQIILPRAKKLAFKSYFNIVPPPPAQTRSVSVVFSSVKGTVFVDYIRLAAHTV